LNYLRQLDPNSRCIGPRIEIKLWLFPPELSRDEQHRQDVSWSRTAAVKQSAPEGDIQKWTNGFWRWIDTRYKPSLRLDERRYLVWLPRSLFYQQHTCSLLLAYTGPMVWAGMAWVMRCRVRVRARTIIRIVQHKDWGRSIRSVLHASTQ
jgi:hypothetical protein